MDPLVTDLAHSLGGFEPLSDLVGTEFPDLDIPTCDLSLRTDKLRFARFLMSQDRVKDFLWRKLEEEGLP